VLTIASKRSDPCFDSRMQKFRGSRYAREQSSAPQRTGTGRMRGRMVWGSRFGEMEILLPPLMQVQQQSAPQQRREDCERERTRNRARRGQLGTYLFFAACTSYQGKVARSGEREGRWWWIWTTARRERREEVGWRRAGKVKIRITAGQPVAGGRVDSGHAAQSEHREDQGRP
jgi:hypothetical protein